MAAADEDNAPVAVEGPHGPIRLKWHELRTRLGEAPFKPKRLMHGWRIGASLELDVMPTADGRFAVLHDFTLGPNTTGCGRVSETQLAALAGLHHRDRDGVADPDAPVLSLAAMLAPLAALPRAPGTLLQFDLKLAVGQALPEAALADAASAAAGIADAIVVGAMDLPQARRLAEAMPGARLGYDPQRAVARMPELLREPERLLAHFERRRAGLALAYLHYGIVVEAAARGFPLVERLLDLGIETDAWTLNPGPRLTDDVLRKVVESGVRQITTDAPHDLARRITALGRARP